MVRVLGSGPHTPTKFFWEYSPPRGSIDQSLKVGRGAKSWKLFPATLQAYFSVEGRLLDPLDHHPPVYDVKVNAPLRSDALSGWGEGSVSPGEQRVREGCVRQERKG